MNRWTFLRAANLALRGADPRFFRIWKRNYVDGIRPQDAS
jgi:hypothetical protein